MRRKVLLSEEFRHIIRFYGTDLEGSKRLEYGLTKIKGVNIHFSNAIIKTANLQPDKRIGNLTDSELQKIEDVLNDPEKYGIPQWLFNRRKDMETGKNLHFIGSELTLRTMSDIGAMRELRSWKGTRHSLGLKVRGQRTKTTGRSKRVVRIRKRRLRSS
ncbi:MAG: 30S ribosomal protein S13 [Candidatus Bathyarchaeota archaeon]|nr:MAG: 30S ribosomal protein S13 [Candidatus Bathyarchaeota archaeon]